ncbi:terminase [Salininema proteolyticum]|uniref:Terminase n=1 Tax=Salininema proteolyticum TaxID=1607685 RepID=A0ABV8TZ11_9ACTN
MTAPLTKEVIDGLEPVFLGPTWSHMDDGSWLLPERTLGWQIAGWCAEFLNSDQGGPWQFTAEQLRWLLWWYAVDEHGRFVHRSGVLQRLKGWGKDPLAAVLCLVELCGPSRFCGWTPEGDPVGMAHPNAWVQVAAVSQSQTRNTMTLFPAIMSDRFIETYGVKPGAELIRAGGGRLRLEAVTSSYRALEGGRSTFTILNETHHWVSGNNGHQMHEVVDGNTTKTDSRFLAITNAYMPGEDSVAERMREAYEKEAEGLALDSGLMYDSVEADPRTPLTPEALRVVLPQIRGDAVWLNIEAIIKSVLSTTISPARSRRMWLNQVVADDEALYSPADWARIETETELQAGDEIVLGFDGGKTDDGTALVAIRVSDATAFVVGYWQAPDGPEAEGWTVPREAVDAAVRSAFDAFNVRAFYADVALWESHIDSWAADIGEGLVVKASGRHPIAWDMRGSLKRSTAAHERLMSAALNGQLRYDGDRIMRRHALNARRRVNNYGVSFGKEHRESKRKVDAYAALMLAHEALQDLRIRVNEKQRTGRGYFV